MSRLDESLNRLQKQVLDEEREKKAERQRKWELIQEKSPETADFLLEINRVFGKPEKTWVEIEGERIL